jgi:MtrB/PioB family decaheme-associated outer membrane protein
VIDYLHIARLFGDGQNYFDLQAVDPGQGDELYKVRLGIGDKLRLRYSFAATPMVFGNKARSVLGRTGPGELRIGDFIQQLLEDPDGNGVPFYSEPAGAADNSLVQGLTNDLLTGVTPFDLELKRRTDELDLTYNASTAWSLGFDYQRHESRGQQPLGSGTYARITDVNGDGVTDYDYFFSVRGVELPSTVEYDTTNATLWASYRQDKWFGDVRYTFSEFDNANPFLLYDNPFWFTPTDATSGQRRGLWEEGRASMPPSNDAWNLTATAGVDLSKTTRLTASFTTGEHSQNDAFAPITTNTALIGIMDLNGDGVIDGRDDPTTTAVLPQSSLNATSDITVMDVRISSRPTDKVRLNASWRTYEYDGGTSNLVIPARTEYIESHFKDNFKGTSLAFVPHAYERENLKAEGVFDLSDAVRLAAYWKRDSYDWQRSIDLEGGASREACNRAVEGTDDDTLGLRLFWDGPGWVDARFHFATSEREFDGVHQVGFDGQNVNLRQYDIANRDRDALEARFDFNPSDTVTFGFEVRNWEDDYTDSSYGFLDAETSGWTADASFVIGERGTLNLYIDSNEAETNMHLRTKCKNCAPPAGADWSPPWGVPNYDWFPTYEDEDMSVGAALSVRSADDVHRFDLQFDYVDAEVVQRNSNPGTPVDLHQIDGPPVNVALAFDFPDQTNTSSILEGKYVRKLSERTSIGILYRYEDWELDDFQVQSLQAYAANFLTVDDATRLMFLDAWYGSYDAQIGQFFVKMNF